MYRDEVEFKVTKDELQVILLAINIASMQLEGLRGTFGDPIAIGRKVANLIADVYYDESRGITQGRR